MLTETIVALSSPPGASPRAVVRLSGPEAFAIAERVFSELPSAGPRHRSGELRLGGWPPAPAAALTFRGPRSYTGEDVVELWVPGAPPLTRRLLLELQSHGARLANPGEFTRRAFLNDRLDLTQAEAVLALTSSQDASSARAALRSLAGGVRARIDALKSGLLDVRAHVEAAIDFSEEDIDLAAPTSLADRLEGLAGDLRALASASAQRLQAGVEPVVALRGPANAGKSTLFNALLGRASALVSDEAGTTRDVLEGLWTLPGGAVVRLLDTAGTKAPEDAVEQRALDVAQDAAASADLQLIVFDATGPGPGGGLLDPQAPQLVVRSKADLLDPPDDLADPPEGSVAVSAASGAGLDALAAAVHQRLFVRNSQASDLLGSARQAGLVAIAGEALARARDQLRGDDPARAELAAVDLAEALEALGELTGEVTTDDMLDRIFGAFCIGK